MTNWDKIEKLRTAAFHGQQLSPDELELCRQAIQEDALRYSRIGDQVRKAYAASLRA